MNKTENFNLSEKRKELGVGGVTYWEEDVKEFIRLLKKELSKNKWYTWQVEGMINSLAGDKLT